MNTVNAQPHSASTGPGPLPWWREPYVWLVVGGPAVVVVAALFTAYIAMRAPDPVIDKNQIQREAIARAAADGRISEDELVKLQPAQLVRNHAAAPVVPKLNPDK